MFVMFYNVRREIYLHKKIIIFIIFVLIVTTGCAQYGEERCIPAFPTTTDVTEGGNGVSLLRVNLGEEDANDGNKGCAALCDTKTTEKNCSYDFEACSKKYKLPTDLSLWSNYAAEVNNKYGKMARRWVHIPIVTQGGEILFKISGRWYADDKYDFITRAYELQLDSEHRRDPDINITLGPNAQSINTKCNLSTEGSNLERLYVLKDANLNKENTNLCYLSRGMGLYFLFLDLEGDPNIPLPNEDLDGLYITPYLTVHVGSQAVEPTEDDSMKASRSFDNIEKEDEYILSLKYAYARSAIDNTIETYEIPRGYAVYAKVLSDEYFSPSGGYNIQFISGVGDVLISDQGPVEQVRGFFLDIMADASKLIYEALIASSAYHVIVTGMLTIFLILTGLSLLMGLVDNPIDIAFKKIFKIIFVIFLASNASWTFFHDTLFALLMAIMHSVIGVMGSAYMPGTYDPTAPFAFVDQILLDYLFDKIIWQYKVPAIIWSDDHLGIPAILVIILVIGVYLMALFQGFIVYLIAVVGMNLMLAIIPIAFLGILFEKLKTTFDSWFKITLGFVMQSIFAFLTLAVFSFGILQYYEKIFGIEICHNNVMALTLPIPFAEENLVILGLPGYTPGIDFIPYDFWNAWNMGKQRIKFENGGNLLYGKVPPRYTEERWYFREFPTYNPSMVNPALEPPKDKTGFSSDKELVDQYGSDLLYIIDHVLKGHFINFYDLFGLCLFALIIFNLMSHMNFMANIIVGSSPQSTTLGAIFSGNSQIGQIFNQVVGAYKMAASSIPGRAARGAGAGANTIARKTIGKDFSQMKSEAISTIDKAGHTVVKKALTSSGMKKTFNLNEDRIYARIKDTGSETFKYMSKGFTEGSMLLGLETDLEQHYNQKFAFRRVDNRRAQINYFFDETLWDIPKAIKKEYFTFHVNKRAIINDLQTNLGTWFGEPVQHNEKYVSIGSKTKLSDLMTNIKARREDEKKAIKISYLGREVFIPDKSDDIEIKKAEDEKLLEELDKKRKEDTDIEIKKAEDTSSLESLNRDLADDARSDVSSDNYSDEENQRLAREFEDRIKGNILKSRNIDDESNLDDK